MCKCIYILCIYICEYTYVNIYAYCILNYIYVVKFDIAAIINICPPT